MPAIKNLAEVSHILNYNSVSEHLSLNECSLSGEIPVDVSLFPSLSKFPLPASVQCFPFKMMSYQDVCVL